MKLIGGMIALAAVAGCSDDGGTIAADAAVDAPTDFVTVTVEARRTPRADVTVYTSRADGSLIAAGVTGADGKIVLPVGASVTATDPEDTLTLPTGDRGELNPMELALQGEQTTWMFDVVAPPNPNGLELLTPCGDNAFVSSATTHSVRIATCGRTTEMAMSSSSSAGESIALAPVPASGPLTFNSWRPVQVVPVTAPASPMWSSHAFFTSYPSADFPITVNRGLVTNMPGEIQVRYQNLSVPIVHRIYARRYADAPAELTVSESDLLPLLDTVTVGSATGARGIQLVVPAGGFDLCSIVLHTLTLGHWAVRSGSLGAGPQTLVIPATSDGTLAVPQDYVEVFCVVNLDFADPSAPMLVTTDTMRF